MTALRESAPAPRRALTALFTAVIFLNAALLFVVQPLFSKLALPLLGGAPAVWNTCMLVFQALLLGGYLYAHLTSRWLRPARQLALHAALLLLSLLVLPIGIREGWAPPPGGAPIPWLVGLILVGMGLPFLLLSTGAPLLQQWFARTDHPDAANPYFLYAASNAGSLLALLAYPFVVEPLLGLGAQRVAWSVAYALVIVLVAACGVVALRGQGVATAEAPAVDGDARADDAARQPLGALTRVRWTLLAFAPSSLLLGVTSYITTDVAVVPLLWVVPLALYLLTFVLVFARRQWVPHGLMLRLQPLLFLPLLVTMFMGRGGSVRLMAPWHLALFFVTAMICHGELARLRPPAARLTEFYLWLSVGGVLGGAFNVLVAPVLFDRVLEYALVLVLACALRPWPAWRQGEGEGEGGAWPALALDMGLAAALGLAVLAVLGWPGPWHPLVASYVVPAVGGAGALACLSFTGRPLRYAAGALAVLAAGLAGNAAGRAPMVAARSFFGAYTVRATESGFHELHHGSTLHGAQNVGDSLSSREPLTYYGLRGPLGDIVGAARLAGRPLRFGVVGLGTGTVACYARPGDGFTFYEIDPLVVTLARDRRLFTYLGDCAPDARVVLGDARLALAADGGALYDVLVLDAFSSDAIPVHLLTREAMRTYLERLAPGGVLAVHVSNRYLNLRPVVAALAGDAGAVAYLGEQRRLERSESRKMYSPSVWMAVARDSATLETLGLRSRWRAVSAPEGTRVWTDDYSNVLGALIW